MEVRPYSLNEQNGTQLDAHTSKAGINSFVQKNNAEANRDTSYQ
jgi:hypothetical protein